MNILSGYIRMMKGKSLNSTDSTAQKLMEEGIRLSDSSRYEKTYYVFSESILLDSTNAEAYFQRALNSQLMEVGRLGIPMSDFSKAIELNPGEGRYYYYRGNYKRWISSSFQMAAKSFTNICKAKELNYQADYSYCECD